MTTTQIIVAYLCSYVLNYIIFKNTKKWMDKGVKEFTKKDNVITLMFSVVPVVPLYACILSYIAVLMYCEDDVTDGNN